MLSPIFQKYVMLHTLLFYRSVTLPQRPVSIECDKVSGESGKGSMRPRMHSHDGSTATVESPEDRRHPPMKKRKSIFERVKNMSAKKKVYQSSSSGNGHVILLGIKAREEEDPICHSLEDVRMPEFPAKVYSIQKDKHPSIQPDSPDGRCLREDHVFMPPLSQSVPSSPVLDRRGSFPLLKSHEEYEQAARTGIPKQSYSASRLRHHRVLSVPNSRENPPSPLLKLQQPNPPAISLSGPGYFRSSMSPSMQISQSSLRTQPTNADPFIEADDEAPLVTTQVSVSC